MNIPTTSELPSLQTYIRPSVDSGWLPVTHTFITVRAVLSIPSRRWLSRRSFHLTLEGSIPPCVTSQGADFDMEYKKRTSRYRLVLAGSLCQRTSTWVFRVVIQSLRSFVVLECIHTGDYCVSASTCEHGVACWLLNHTGLLDVYYHGFIGSAI